MFKALAIQVSVCLFAPWVGVLVAFGLRGEWNGALLVAFFLALVLGSHAVITIPRDLLLHTLLALGFYATAFQGLLGPLDGALGAVWFLLIILFSLIQVGCVFLSSLFFRNLAFRAVVFPFGMVVFEFFRHQATKLYDGSGLTFCLFGQAVASDSLLLQSADLGGVWMLSFYGVALGAAISIWFHLLLSLRFRIAYMVVVLGMFGSAYTYGYYRLRNTDTLRTGSETILVYVCPEKPGVSQLSKLSHSIQARKDHYRWEEIIVVYPETCITWQSNPDALPEQNALLQLSKLPNVMVIVGAWYPATSDSSRNVSIIAKDGQVVTAVDKAHLATFVESKPFGTNHLVAAGLVPQVVSRNVAAAEPIDQAVWRSRTLKAAPSVCYDLFFSESFRRFPADRIGFSTCSLDETFDGNGVFRKLSRMHSTLRAVEMRQPLVRSSLGGFSGVFDRTGRVMNPLELNADFAIFQLEPEYLETVYERWGDWFPIACCTICIASVFVDRVLVRAPQDES